MKKRGTFYSALHLQMLNLCALARKGIVKRRRRLQQQATLGATAGGDNPWKRSNHENLKIRGYTFFVAPHKSSQTPYASNNNIKNNNMKRTFASRNAPQRGRFDFCFCVFPFCLLFLFRFAWIQKKTCRQATNLCRLCLLLLVLILINKTKRENRATLKKTQTEREKVFCD